MSWWFPLWVAGWLATHPRPDTGDLLLQLDALQQTGRVLYVTAHPDDENTRLMAWLHGHLGVQVACVSLTRGEGGQNLIGTEQGALLGVIRTWELLQARAIDGALQFFGTVHDFGFSKSAEESLAIWSEDHATLDLVRIVRRMRPHLVITRFPETGNTHGHHLASARLARRAFHLAADPAVVLTGEDDPGPWQADALWHNVSTWYLTPGALPEGDARVDLGRPDPRIGESWPQRAARSRSEHRSQGFGSVARPGPVWEALDGWEGLPPDPDAPFAWLRRGWDTVEGGATVHAALTEARAHFHPDTPETMLPALGRAMEALNALPDPWLADATRPRIHALMAAALGVQVEARVEAPLLVAGAPVTLQWLGTARAPVRVVEVAWGPLRWPVDAPLDPVWERAVQVEVPADLPMGIHAWLRRPAAAGHDVVEPDEGPGMPVDLQGLVVAFELEAQGVRFRVEQPIRQVRVDPVHGPRTGPVQGGPAITVTPPRGQLLCARAGACRLQARVEVHAAVSGAQVWWVDDAGQTVLAPQAVEAAPGESVARTWTLEVGNPAAGTVLALEARWSADGREPAPGWRLDALDLPPAPRVGVLQASRVTVHVPPVEAWGHGPIGYVQGPGDEVMAGMQAVGWPVVAVDPRTTPEETWSTLGALVVGIRALNRDPDLLRAWDRVVGLARSGATVLVQYQTTQPAVLLPAGEPGALTLGRTRVTDEAAAVRRLEPGARLWRVPHVLEDSDWAGWVQERSLYHGATWEGAWQPMVAMADPGEDPQEGALLVARVGRGRMIYTGLSFFRQLPAGVPGAWRLWRNLLEPGHGEDG
jgi:LmbE family N-acetylglucosaminyl deacetylase